MHKSLKISYLKEKFQKGARLKRWGCAIFLSVLPFFLSACQFAILDPKGQVAADEKQILWISVVLMLLVVVPVILLTLGFAWRYRAGNSEAKYSPNWQHSTLLEVVWWSIPCLIIAVLGTITWISSHRLDPYRPLEGDKKVLVIEAVALEWKWLFIYPEQQIATVNYIQLPVGVPVRFLITAEGPMNSLQIPQLGGQIYAMAGMQTQLNLIADVPGDYRGLSTNFSGDGFSDMHFTARASSQQAFERWVKKVKRASGKLTLETYQTLSQPAVSPVKYYSAVPASLFETVVMKAMMPMTAERKGN